MKRIVPGRIFAGEPCSVVAVGCALNVKSQAAVEALKSPLLHSDGYLSLDGMNRLIRANMRIKKRTNFARGARPCLRDFCHEFKGRAIVCVKGHFVYVENGDYYSFLKNGSDEVITVWEIQDGSY